MELLDTPFRDLHWTSKRLAWNQMSIEQSLPPLRAETNNIYVIFL